MDVQIANIALQVKTEEYSRGRRGFFCGKGGVDELVAHVEVAQGGRGGVARGRELDGGDIELVHARLHSTRFPAGVGHAALH